jgi:two-component sensor histidine kinase
MVRRSPIVGLGDEPLLYVNEFLHRVRNEYASVISLASLKARPVLERIVRRVSDDGSSSTVRFMPGTGTHLVDALAADLDGYVERRFSKSGTTATLSFPKHPPLFATGKETLQPIKHGV